LLIILLLILSMMLSIQINHSVSIIKNKIIFLLTPWKKLKILTILLHPMINLDLNTILIISHQNLLIVPSSLLVSSSLTIPCPKCHSCHNIAIANRLVIYIGLIMNHLIILFNRYHLVRLILGVFKLMLFIEYLNKIVELEFKCMVGCFFWKIFIWRVLLRLQVRNKWLKVVYLRWQRYKKH
jgi:hypothetical protein